ncbi:Rieske 2Fe-2S domain-containing protein [Acinetobacter baumannii]|uniref:Rieske (2Fe-2S) protein n=1 Tax=Acinetobacter baumannii TaxID=470 RepID=UPI001CAA74AC|nr:Rieske 2Fe-2S domain-containing protein [Acinetobacter baumannii]MBZ0345038.1 Rieske 2Fe-2S domain-containing protein [Acinetobacter baumannii]MBZ0362877.1 Rieske 2Fe-2S domain-containing protein [Acinetobacter baumannii]MBZ0419345.1 Rieske 2Fe-2S domain-containing protein [Acinetobacter baumannii]
MIKLCDLTEFDNQKCFKVGHPIKADKSIVVIKGDDSFYAYENVCPHFSVQLDYKPGVFNTYQNKHIMCAHHSAMFDIVTGKCIEGPCRGHSLIPIEIEIQENKIFFKC